MLWGKSWYTTYSPLEGYPDLAHIPTRMVVIYGPQSETLEERLLSPFSVIPNRSFLEENFVVYDTRTLLCEHAIEGGRPGGSRITSLIVPALSMGSMVGVDMVLQV